MENTPNTDPLAEIQSRLENPPKMWTPRGVPEDAEVEKCLDTTSVAGIVESIEDQEDEYDGHRLVVISCADRSRVSIRGFGTILGSFFGKVEIGDAVGIQYEGTATPRTPGYSDYPVYRVERIPARRELAAVPSMADESELPLGPGNAAAS